METFGIILLCISVIFTIVLVILFHQDVPGSILQDVPDSILVALVIVTIVCFITGLALCN